MNITITADTVWSMVILMLIILFYHKIFIAIAAVLLSLVYEIWLAFVTQVIKHKSIKK